MASGSSIKDDERVILFPTAAALDEGGQAWLVPVHGWIFEPESDSMWRSAAIGGLLEALGRDRSLVEETLFRERARMFLVDNERGKRLEAEILGRRVELEVSSPDGHFTGLARLPRALAADHGLEENGWLALEAVTRPGDPRRFAGAAQLLAPEGLSIVSDIDDTVKLSDVADKRELLANTFLRPFRAVPGMAALYRRWAEAGAAFHYLSASPWQLYPVLSDFLGDQGFPRGSFHLKPFRAKDRSLLDLFAAPETYKVPLVEAMLRRFPRRGFVLVGDSGERDPEIYGMIARRFPRQVRHIFIREAASGASDGARYRAAFDGVPPERWTVFREAVEVIGEPFASDGPRD